MEHTFKSVLVLAVVGLAAFEGASATIWTFGDAPTPWCKATTNKPPGTVASNIHCQYGLPSALVGSGGTENRCFGDGFEAGQVSDRQAFCKWCSLVGGEPHGC